MAPSLESSLRKNSVSSTRRKAQGIIFELAVTSLDPCIGRFHFVAFIKSSPLFMFYTIHL